jgi:pimeloyl-[acyl-carrier protein] methyl ester esterase
VSLACRVRRTGRGADLALIHGWALSGEVWAPLVDRLSERFTVHVVDLPGYGGLADGKPGDTAPAGATAGDNLGAIADAVMAALPERITLCGWSLGAHVAVAALARHSRRVERLVLCAATPCFVRKPDWPHGVTPELLGTFETMLRLSPQKVVSRFAAMINQGDAAMREVARHTTAVAELPLPERAVLLGGLTLLRQIDWRPLAQKIHQPVMVVHGDADPLMPLPGAQAMASLFPAAQVETFEGSAHTPFLSRPDRFVEALRRFAAA